MDFLQQAIRPLRDALAAMPLASRWAAAILIVMILGGLGMLATNHTSEEFEYLFGGRSLSESEVDSVELAFSQAGLRNWVREGRRIRVPSGMRSEYLAAMSDSANLPLALRSSVQEAIDKASPWESNDQRIARELHAKAQDLGKKISSSFPEIRWASVEYDRGERTGLTRTRPQSASVIVSPEGTEPLPPARIKMIKEFVRGAYAGMTAEDVVVTDTNASHTSGYGDEDPLLKRRREEEAAYEQKVLRALVGYGPIRVAAHAELDPTMEAEKATLKYDPPPTLLPIGRNQVASLNTNSRVSGSPTASEGISNRAMSLDTDDDHSGADGLGRRGLMGQQYEMSKLASLQVRRVRISVGLPTSYYDKVLLQDFLRENPGKSPAEMPPPSAQQLAEKRAETETKIKAAVAQLLPLAPAGEDPYPLVHVWDYPDLPAPTLAVLGPATEFWSWLSQSWKSVALAGLGVAALLLSGWLLVGSSGRSKRASADSFDRHADPHLAGAAAQQELQRMVEQNPDLAIGVLRSWMAEAA